MVDASGGVHLRNRTALGEADVAMLGAVARLGDPLRRTRTRTHRRRRAARVATNRPRSRHPWRSAPQRAADAPSGRRRPARAGALAVRERHRRPHRRGQLPDARARRSPAARAVGERHRERARRASSSPNAAAASAGPRAATSSGSRPGSMIPSATRSARRSTCATRRRGEYWSATPAPVRHDARVRRGACAGRDALPAPACRDRVGPHAGDGGRGSGEARGAARDESAARRPRRLTVTSYVEWTLGVLREQTLHRVRDALRRRALGDPRATIRSIRSSRPGSPSPPCSEPVDLALGGPPRLRRAERDRSRRPPRLRNGGARGAHRRGRRSLRGAARAR